MAPNPYDPDDPCGLGNEWRVTRETSQPIRAQNDVILHALDSTNARTIQFVWVYLTQAQALAAAGGTGFEIEIYEEGNLGTPELVATQFRPGADVRNFMGNNPGDKALAWGSFAPSGTNVDIYRGINGTTLTPGIWPNSVPIDPQPVDNDQFIYSVFGAGYDVAFHVDDIGATFVPSTQRVTRVVTKAIVGFYIWSQLINGMGIKPYLMVNGQQDFRAYPEVIHAGVGGGTLVEASWTYNPISRRSWRPGELGLFDTANEQMSCAMGWQVAPTGSSNNLATILQAWMEVETTTDAVDARVATACLSTATTAGFAPPKVGWNQVPLFEMNPPGFGWDKAADTSYVVMMRRTAGGGLVAVRKLDSSPDQVPPHVWQPAFCQLPDPALVPVSYFRLVGPPWEQFQGQNWAMLLEDDGGNLDPDSQPYASVNGDQVAELAINTDWTPVHTGVAVEQDFTPPAGAEYGFIRFVGWLDGLDADADLVATVHRRSDDVQFGGTATVAAADLVEPKDRPQVLECQLDTGATLVGGTQYYLKFASNAVAATGWHVQVLSTYEVGTINGPPSDVGDVTFGGVTERAHIAGTPHDELDLAAAIYTEPAPPGAFAAIDAGIAPYDYVELTWDATDVAAEGCGAFTQYEVQRSDDGGTTWRKRWRITDEAVTHLFDVECRRNREMAYRIRVRRADHATSDWVTIEHTLTTSFCGYWFGSNEWGDAGPEQLRWADDIGDRDTDYPEDDAVRRTFYRRPFGTTFRGLDFDGAQFDRTLLLAGHGTIDGTVDTPTTPGQEVWIDFMTPLLPSLGATVSYVAVSSNQGDQWLAAITVTGTHNTEPDGSYEIKVHISEETDVPSEVLITS